MTQDPSKVGRPFAYKLLTKMYSTLSTLFFGFLMSFTCILGASVIIVLVSDGNCLTMENVGHVEHWFLWIKITSVTNGLNANKVDKGIIFADSLYKKASHAFRHTI
mgnify:CR=1 FL=1